VHTWIHAKDETGSSGHQVTKSPTLARLGRVISQYVRPSFCPGFITSTFMPIMVLFQQSYTTSTNWCSWFQLQKVSAIIFADLSAN